MRYIVFFFFIISSGACIAQDIISLDPLSVTSSRLSLKTSEAGRSITVIDKKMITAWPVNSLDELLKYVAAVEIQQRGPAGSQADIVIRGGTFQQVLVMMDGMKTNDPLSGHFSSYFPIATSQIERIEILKGPAAAVYGTEAVGGVINIISKSFADQSQEKTTEGNAGLTAGEYEFLAANAGFYKRTQQLNYSLAAQTTNSKGQLLRGTNRGYFHNHLFSGTAATTLNNNWKLALHSSFDTRDFAAQNFYTTFVSDTAVEKVDTWWNHLKLSHKTSSGNDEIDIAYKRTSDYFLFNPKAIANENKSGLSSIQYIHSSQISQDIIYNYGISGEQKTIRSNDRGNHNNLAAAVFGSAVYKINKLTLNPGIRLASDQNYGTRLVPQANVSFNLNKVILKANAGRAIRSADFTERYNNYKKPIVNSGNIGNPDLQTENSWSYEVGADIFISDMKFSAAAFLRNQHDVIDWVITPYANMPRKENLNPNGTYGLAKNIKEVETTGIELEYQYSKKFLAKQQLYINLAATFLNSKSTDAIPSFYIISHAKTILQQSILYRIGSFGLSLTSIYKQRLPLQAPAIKAMITKDYWLVNTKLDYKIKDADLFIAINNLGDIQYSDLLGSKMPGRWLTAGFDITFK